MFLRYFRGGTLPSCNNRSKGGVISSASLISLPTVQVFLIPLVCGFPASTCKHFWSFPLILSLPLSHRGEKTLFCHVALIKRCIPVGNSIAKLHSLPLHLVITLWFIKNNMNKSCKIDTFYKRTLMKHLAYLRLLWTKTMSLTDCGLCVSLLRCACRHSTPSLIAH